MGYMSFPEEGKSSDKHYVNTVKIVTGLVTSVGDLYLITAGPEESAPLPESEERGDFFLGTESRKQCFHIK